MTTKAKRYAELVARRKKFDLTGTGLENPSLVEGGIYDSNHIGPWTRWANDLDAELMIVGQDWGDVRYFRANHGLDNPSNPTNRALIHLLATIGKTIPQPPSKPEQTGAERGSCGIWMTNALLFLKTGGLSAPLRDDWLNEGAQSLLRGQVDIVKPRAIVALGASAYDAVLACYDMAKRRGAFKRVVENTGGVLLPEPGATLFGVYHCGARIQNSLRRLPQQEDDWRKIAMFLADAGAVTRVTTCN